MTEVVWCTTFSCVKVLGADRIEIVIELHGMELANPKLYSRSTSTGMIWKVLGRSSDFCYP